MEFLTALRTSACWPLLGLDVVDCSGLPVGTLLFLWHHAGVSQVQFFGVQTAAISDRGLVVPAEGVQVDQRQGSVRVPYPRALVHEASAYAWGAELTLERERGRFTRQKQNR